MKVHLLFHGSDRFDGSIAQLGNNFVRNLNFLCCHQSFFRQTFFNQTLFHMDDILNLIQEEQIDSGNAINFFRFNSTAKRFCNHKYTFIICSMQEAADIIQRLAVQFSQMQISFSYFQRTYSFEKRSF